MTEPPPTLREYFHGPGAEPPPNPPFVFTIWQYLVGVAGGFLIGTTLIMEIMQMRGLVSGSTFVVGWFTWLLGGVFVLGPLFLMLWRNSPPLIKR